MISTEAIPTKAINCHTYLAWREKCKRREKLAGNYNRKEKGKREAETIAREKYKRIDDNNENNHDSNKERNREEERNVDDNSNGPSGYLAASTGQWRAVNGREQ